MLFANRKHKVKREGHDPRWTELGKYIRRIVDAMGLGEWYFTISHDPPEPAEHANEEGIAQVYISAQSVKVIYCVGDVFWTKDQYEQRWSVVHELLHVVEAPYANALHEGLEGPVTTWNVINQLRERFIDQTALMLSRRFSLPPNGFLPVKKKEKR